jgi:hypothetical protein
MADYLTLYGTTSVLKSSWVATFFNFLGFKTLYYKFREILENCQNIREDRSCKNQGVVWQMEEGP